MLYLMLKKSIDMTSLVNVKINEYDTGVDDTDKSVQVVPTESGLEEISELEMINPFFVSLNNQSSQDGEIYKKPHVYVICMRDNHNVNPKMLYDHVVNKQHFLETCKDLSLLQSTHNLLYNNNFKSMVKSVPKETLVLLFPNSQYQFENEELVLPMFELTDSKARMNISLYDKMYGIKDLSTFVQLISYYNGSYKRPIMRQFEDHLTNIRDSQFWKNSNNCRNINMTNVFSDRGFEYKVKKMEMFKKSLEKMNQKEEEKVLDILQPKLNSKQISHEDYLHQLNNPGGEDIPKQDDPNQKILVDQLKKTTYNTDFYDIFKAMKNADKRTYYINNNLDIDQDYINNIFTYLTEEEELYHVLNMLLVSKDYCHMALHPYVLSKVGYLMTKYASLYKYLFGYTWLCMMIEESIMKTKATRNDRFTFDINNASNLPYFPFTYEDIFQNPYIILPVESKTLDMQNNILSFPCLVNGDQYYGVCNFNDFKYRSNIFMTGDATKDPLGGLDWKYFGISGSMLPACMQKKSPLFNQIVDDHMNDEEKWKLFFNHYYEDADIDLMCSASSIFDFLNKAESVVKCLDKNLGENTTKVHYEKSMATHVTKQFFTEMIDDFNEQYDKNCTPEEMCDLISKEQNELHEYLYEIYVSNKIKSNKIIRKNKENKNNRFVQYLMEPNSMKELNINVMNYDKLKENTSTEANIICFYINDFRKSDPVPEDENLMILRFSENLKFKIKNDKLLHQVELFRTHKEDFFGMVARFHLPCVRAYYQGDNVYMTSSCITAMMTGINIDYKYFAGSRDPIDIINKYRMRGFSTILSTNEKEHMEEYNKHITTCGGMFNCSKDGETTFGCKTLGSSIYKPKVYKEGLPEDIYKNTSTGYIMKMDDLINHYKVKYNYDVKSSKSMVDMFKFKVINDDGSINPLEAFVTRAYWNSMNI